MAKVVELSGGGAHLPGTQTIACARKQLLLGHESRAAQF